MNTDKVDEILEKLDEQIYKKRVREEFIQLTERIEKLNELIGKIKDDKERKRNYSFVLLNHQLQAMELYRDILWERSQVENIPLTEEE